MSARATSTTCCNANCEQGRDCPVRQACQLPEPSPRGFGLRVLWLHAKRWYLSAALRQMHPLHHDLPQAVHELRDVERELAGRT